MASLLNADPNTITALADRARNACVVYRRHPLPPGCNPDSGDIGVERDSAKTLLHLRRGVTYQGADHAVREWVTEGTRSFDNLDACVGWLRDRVAGIPSAPPAATQPPPRRLHVDDVTDLSLVDVPAAEAPTTQDLAAALSAQILGQGKAVQGLAELVTHHLAKSHPRRPASALLVGATGTGKTLAAEQLAEWLTETQGSEWSYQRLDMNEFSERHSVSRLFGAPPGYVGYADGRDLATLLRANPRTVVLLDEIDKAHPQALRSLMNLMDAGRLGAHAGDIDARQAILLFTSNKDAAALQRFADADDQRLRGVLREHGYAPEIVARFGRILVFEPLGAEATARIVVLIVQRVVESFGLQLTHIAPEAVSDLAGRAPLHAGGRDVEYFIERELSASLAPLAARFGAVWIDLDLDVQPVDAVPATKDGAPEPADT